MGSAVIRPRVRGLALLAASCVVACAISAPDARAVASDLSSCPGPTFQYTGEFRFPPAPEGFAPDCAINVGALTVEADAGQPAVNVGLPGVGVVVDDRGRLAHFNAPAGPRFDMQQRGRPIASVADSTERFALTYDRAGRLKKASSSSSAITLTYNTAGLVAKLGLGSGVSESFSYDSSGEVVGYSDSGGDTASFTYSQGHLSGAVITLTAVDPTFSFTYSSGGALTAWSETNGASEAFQLTTDSAGDVTAVKQGTTTDAALTYLKPHVLSQVNNGATTDSFTYDGNGRLSSATTGSPNTTSFLYGSSGRLSSVTYPSGLSSTETSTLTYDSLGRLVKVAANGGERIRLVYVPVPTARTQSATNVGQRTATLNGAVNPHGLPAEYRFQFGRTQSYGHSTQPHSAGNGKQLVAVAASLGQLTPGTTYHYRLIATTAAGTTVGSDRSLHTQ